jgi:hypothetical protein
MDQNIKINKTEKNKRLLVEDNDGEEICQNVSADLFDILQLTRRCSCLIKLITLVFLYWYLFGLCYCDIVIFVLWRNCYSNSLWLIGEWEHCEYHKFFDCFEHEAV